jgi:hypothetical protein
MFNLRVSLAPFRASIHLLNMDAIDIAAALPFIQAYSLNFRSNQPRGNSPTMRSPRRGSASMSATVSRQAA